MTEDLVSKLDPTYTLRVLEDMIRTNSIVGHEGELANYLHDQLKVLGLDAELHEVEPDRPNVYGRLQGKGPGRHLHFNGHMDTVHQPNEFAPLDWLEPVCRMYALIAARFLAGEQAQAKWTRSSMLSHNTDLKENGKKGRT